MEDNNKELTLRERISEDPFFLSSLSERATLLWYGSYALFNGILGVYHKSYWFISMAAWYLIIAGVRMLALKDNDGNQTGKAGTGICLLAIVLSGIVCTGIAEQQNPAKDLIVMIAMAAYTFALVTNAVINAIKANKKNDDRLVIQRDIAMVSSIGSLLSLQRSMLGSFGDASDRFTLIMEAVSGAAAFLIILLIGLSLLRRKRNKK